MLLRSLAVPRLLVLVLAPLALASTAFAASPKPVAAPAAIKAPHVHFVGKPTGGQILVIDGAHGSRPVVAIGANATVEKLLVSPTGKKAAFYAQLKPGETRTVVLVDVATAKVTATYRPGVGGEFYFSTNDALIQVAGCGSGCASLDVRDATGKSLGHFDCAGFDAAHELSSDGRFAACFSNDGLSVIDTSTGSVALTTKTPCEGPSVRDGFRFEGVETARFSCYDKAVTDDVDVMASWSPIHREITKHAIHAP